MEEVTECALQATPTSRISLQIRLALDRGSPDHVLSTVFSTTNDNIELDNAYLPSRDTLIALVRRVKGNHSQLKTFKLVIDYSFLGFRAEDIPEDNLILKFEYREDESDAGDDWRPLIHDNKDLCDPPDNADALTDAGQFQYAAFPKVIRTGYQRLVHDREVIEREGLAALLNLPAAAAGIGNVGNVGVEVADGRD
jgi:hypothetical protein